MARIGIDLGTTNTVVGMVYDNGPHVVPRGQGRFIPSVVAYPAAGPGSILVGEAADAFEAGGPVVRSVKRLMGRTYGEAKRERSENYFPENAGDVRLARHGDNDVGLELAGAGEDKRFLWPEDVTAEILREARSHAERALGVPIEAAAITVPAYFRDPHREATLEAARSAGIEVIGALLDEPTAAALAFAPHVALAVGEPVLVVDWGGGTLDVTVLFGDGAEWVQLAIDGELTLGGDDIDSALVDLALSRESLDPTLLTDPRNRRELRRAARLVKEALSQEQEATFLCPRLIEPGSDRRLPPLALSVSRREFEEAVQPLLASASDCVKRCLSHRDVVTGQIRKLLLVGGSSRIPAFRNALRTLLPQAELCHDVDPMEAVALGAAGYANRPPQIARICPYGYAYLHEDGTPTTVVPTGSEIPTPAQSRFGLRAATSFQGQTIYRLRLVPFTVRANGEKVLFPESQRLFARQMPSTEMGHRVDVEVWLDENKTVKAQCHIQGLGTPYALEGSERGAEELFTRLFDQQLDAEALLAANPDASGGLVEELREAITRGERARAARDREPAAAVIEAFLDLRAQFEAARQDALHRALVPKQRRDGERIEGWFRFYERELVPRFADLLAPSQFEEVITALCALRVGLRTGASVEEMEEGMSDLDRALFVGPAGTAARAWKRAETVGVPPTVARRLKLQALELRRALLEKDEAVTSGLARNVDQTLDESSGAWNRWRETQPLLDAGADLRVVREGGNRGN